MLGAKTSQQPTAATLVEQVTAATATAREQSATATAAIACVQTSEQAAATVSGLCRCFRHSECCTNQQCECSNAAHHSPIHRFSPKSSECLVRSEFAHLVNEPDSWGSTLTSRRQRANRRFTSTLGGEQN
jgi:hypothetical protein